MELGSSSLQQRCQSFQFFQVFEKIGPILDHFRNLTSKQYTKGSGLKGVATSSASKRCQTNLFAQLEKLF